METETTLPADDFDDEYGEFVFYGTTYYNDLSPYVKKFLFEYFGERMYSLESETYRKVESLIKKRFEMDGDRIVDLFKDNRTIPDEAEWDEAFDNFEGLKTPIIWPPNKPEWYHTPFSDDDDGEFLEGIPESELTENQKTAKQIVDMIDNGMIFNNGLQRFLNTGCPILIRDIQKYLERTAPFYLFTLSPKGFALLQERIENAANFLYEDLFEELFEP